jgi:hypothetical protein
VRRLAGTGPPRGDGVAQSGSLKRGEIRRRHDSRHSGCSVARCWADSSSNVIGGKHVDGAQSPCSNIISRPFRYSTLSGCCPGMVPRRAAGTPKCRLALRSTPTIPIAGTTGGIPPWRSRTKRAHVPAMSTPVRPVGPAAGSQQPRSRRGPSGRCDGTTSSRKPGTCVAGQPGLGTTERTTCGNAGVDHRPPVVDHSPRLKRRLISFSAQPFELWWTCFRSASETMRPSDLARSV